MGVFKVLEIELMKTKKMKLRKWLRTPCPDRQGFGYLPGGEYCITCHGAGEVLNQPLTGLDRPVNVETETFYRY